MEIKFGTDGWRGVIADDFTFENLGKVALATAKYYKNHKKIKNGILIGYDSRFLGKEFAEHVGLILGNNGINVLISDRISSTPMISLLTKKINAAAGIIITASHNPPRYNGYKIKGDFGGPAFPETITRIEKKLETILESKKNFVPKRNLKELKELKIVRYIDMSKMYLEDLKKKFDIDKINRSGIRILHDAMYGAGMNILTALLKNAHQIHSEYNPSFSGVNPEPIEANLKKLMQKVKTENYDLGIATDGDADRIGLVDEKGNYVDPHRVFSLLLKYLVEEKGLIGEVARSFTVTDIVEKQCEEYKIKLHTTPVGFKHICKLMSERKIIIGGEESGGLGVMGHIPERDGIYLGLLVAEILINRKKTLSQLIKELEDQYGKRYYRRFDHHITFHEKHKIMSKFNDSLKEVAGYKVNRIEMIDGFKYYVNNGWLLVRPSGTEPLIRYYAETDSLKKTKEMLNWAMEK